MTIPRDAEFDAHLDALHERTRFSFLSSVRQSSEILFALDPIEYCEKRDAWYEDQRLRAMGRDSLPCHARNSERFRRLVEVASRKRVVPFVGAGVSASCGFPTWAAFLEDIARDHGFSIKRLRELLAKGAFERAAAALADHVGVPGFTEAFRRAFDRAVDATGYEIPRTILEVCSGPTVTTNYDQLLERIVGGRYLQVFAGRVPGEFLRLAREGAPVLLKVHGDLNVPQNRVLTTGEYNDAYGKDLLPPHRRELVRTLRSLFVGHSLLFIGCSLASDRTMKLLRAVAQDDPDGRSMHHFAIVEAPKNKRDLPGREKILNSRQIFPIWYPHGEHEQLTAILRHLRRAVSEI